jgi:hypothetical protein
MFGFQSTTIGGMQRRPSLLQSSRVPEQDSDFKSEMRGVIFSLILGRELGL